MASNTYESPEEQALRNVNPYAPKQNTYAPKTKLPSGKTSYKPGIGPAVTGMATGVGANIAGSQVTNALTGGGASTPAWASGAAGMGAGIGINMAGNALAEKKRVKEEMPTYGGRHGDIIDSYGRRFEGTGGGIEHGAIQGATMGSNPALLAATGGVSAGVGAAAGAIAAAATKNAPSAFTDFSANDAYDAIGKAYKKYLGRDANDDEIMNHLRAQGYDPTKGHRWVGERGLNSVLDAIADSPEAQARLGQASPTPDQTPPTPSTGATQASAPTLTTPTQTATSPGQSYSSYTNSLPNQQKQDNFSGPQDFLQLTPEQRAQIDRINQNSSEGPGGITGKQEQSGGLKTEEVPQTSATPQNNSSWDTDGYSTPAYTAGKTGNVMDGWDANKWADTNHQTPKYVVGRILSNYSPTPEGLKQAVAEIQKAYPGATFDGKDVVTIPGVGAIDVLKGADVGGQGWQWMDTAEQQAGNSSPTGVDFMSSGQSSPFSSAPPDMGGNGNYSDRIIQYLLQQMALDRAATGYTK